MFACQNQPTERSLTTRRNVIAISCVCNVVKFGLKVVNFIRFCFEITDNFELHKRYHCFEASNFNDFRHWWINSIKQCRSEQINFICKWVYSESLDSSQRTFNNKVFSISFNLFETIKIRKNKIFAGDCEKYWTFFDKSRFQTILNKF